MRYSVLISIVFLLSLASCYNPSPNQSFNDLQVLVGDWTSTENIQFNESWIHSNDTLYTGLGFSLKKGDTLFAEQLKIYLSGDEVYYAAKVGSGSDFVSFKLEKADKEKWEFVNREHDYPNIIQYKVENDSLLEATTMNIRRKKEIVFKLKRVANEVF